MNNAIVWWNIKNAAEMRVYIMEYGERECHHHVKINIVIALAFN